MGDGVLLAEHQVQHGGLKRHRLGFDPACGRVQVDRQRGVVAQGSSQQERALLQDGLPVHGTVRQQGRARETEQTLHPACSELQFLTAQPGAAPVWVIATDEESMIARHTLAALGGAAASPA